MPGTKHPDKRWYAIYTKPRNEKKVNQFLLDAGIVTYLPLQKVLKQWSDRKKWVDEPLFKSYLFVHITPAQYYEVLNAWGVVRYITFEGKAVIVPPAQILAIRQFINEEAGPEQALEHFEKGDRVEIFRGSLKGLIGQLVEVRGRQKVRIEIEAIGQSIVLTIPKSYLKVIGR
jgi:transcription antitermination factor NusG